MGVSEEFLIPIQLKHLNWAIGAEAAIAPATMCGNLVLMKRESKQ